MDCGLWKPTLNFLVSSLESSCFAFWRQTRPSLLRAESGSPRDSADGQSGDTRCAFGLPLRRCWAGVRCPALVRGQEGHGVCTPLLGHSRVRGCRPLL